MTAPLTDEQLAEIEAGLKGVTEGPWAATLAANPIDGAFDCGIMCGGQLIAEAFGRSSEKHFHPAYENAHHIARLNPETVAAWLARDKAQRASIAELEAGNKRLEAELADYRKYYSIGDMKLTVSPDLHGRDKEGR